MTSKTCIGGLSTSQVYNNSWFSDLAFTRALPIFPCLSDHLVREVFFPSEHNFYSGETKESQRRKEKGSREDSTDGRWDPKAKETSPRKPHEMGQWVDGMMVASQRTQKGVFLRSNFDYVGTIFSWWVDTAEYIDYSSSMGFPSLEMLHYWYIPIHCCWTSVFLQANYVCVCAKVADRFAECFFFPMFLALKPGLFTTAIAEVVNKSWEERSFFWGF